MKLESSGNGTWVMRMLTNLITVDSARCSSTAAGGIGQSYPGSCADFPPNRLSESRYFDNVILHNQTIVQTEGFCTDVFFEAATMWIEKQRQSNIPFFAYISTNAPHGPMLAPSQYTKRFAEDGWDEIIQGAME